MTDAGRRRAGACRLNRANHLLESHGAAGRPNRPNHLLESHGAGRVRDLLPPLRGVCYRLYNHIAGTAQTHEISWT